MQKEKMASEATVERVGDELLMCSICYERFRVPKVLPCLHTFCEDCIRRHFDIHKLRNSGRVSCPSCRELIPPPPGGIAGFRNDGVVSRIEELLRSLPGLEIEEEEESEGEGEEDPGGMLLAGACGVDSRMVQGQRQSLASHVSNMQTALTRLCTKILQLYTIENHVKHTIESEVNSKRDRLAGTGHQPSTEWLKQTRERITVSYAPTMAQLASEQDKLYQRIVDIKAVHDVTEEILANASPKQFDGCFDILTKQAHAIRSLVDRLIQEGSPSKSVDKLVPEFNLPANMAKDADLLMNISEVNQAKRIKTAENPYINKSVKDKLVTKISGRGATPCKFDYPTYATFMHNGDFIVTDKNNQRLQIFDNKGKLKRIMLEGMLKPRRARVCPMDGYLYISDELSTSVKVVTLEGKEVRRIGDMQFQCPAGMAFDSKGHLIMTDSEKCYVYVFKRNGAMVTRFFYRYFSDKNMPNPYFVAVNEDDQIIVSDFRNGRVKIFSITGTLLFMIENLVVPRGVCVDPYGNILIAESDKHRISMYSPYGKFLQYLINEEEFGLKYPMSLDINEEGQLLVTQCGHYESHEVLLFQLY